MSTRARCPEPCDVNIQDRLVEQSINRIRETSGCGIGRVKIKDGYWKRRRFMKRRLDKRVMKDGSVEKVVDERVNCEKVFSVVVVVWLWLTWFMVMHRNYMHGVYAWFRMGYKCYIAGYMHGVNAWVIEMYIHYVQGLCARVVCTGYGCSTVWSNWVMMSWRGLLDGWLSEKCMEVIKADRVRESGVKKECRCNSHRGLNLCMQHVYTALIIFSWLHGYMLNCEMSRKSRDSVNRGNGYNALMLYFLLYLLYCSLHQYFFCRHDHNVYGSFSVYRLNVYNYLLLLTEWLCRGHVMADDAVDDVTPFQVVCLTDLFRLTTAISFDPQIPSNEWILARSSFTNPVVRNVLIIEEDVDLQGRPKIITYIIKVVK